jgi:hypothetical protein
MKHVPLHFEREVRVSLLIYISNSIDTCGDEVPQIGAAVDPTNVDIE